MKIKDFYLSLLSESEDYMHLDADSIASVKDVDFSKANDYIKLTLVTTYEKEVDLVTQYSVFKKWYLAKCAGETPCDQPYLAFAKEYIANSIDKGEEAPVNEIIDDEGNIIGDDDKPNNATNSMVGTNNNWDLERTGRSLGRNKYRYYAGTYGQGFVTW